MPHPQKENCNEKNMRNDLKIEFTQTMYPYMFENGDGVERHVDALNRLTASNTGDPQLALWDYISLGYDHSNDHVLGVIYSPRALGRDFRDTPNDIHEAYFCVFDNYVYNVDVLTLERLQDDFGEEHDNYCDQSLSDLFDAWVARNQKMTLQKNIDPSTVSSKRKL